ncbi:glycosyltransferase family 2 protein [Quadrisphaera sp. KR29]|uniref:glycosyltransferase family 2 protein n=1 Tax=Quadrisphaera sp. KR29 TaxID=3461391 RepID=UPI004044CB00
MSTATTSAPAAWVEPLSGSALVRARTALPEPPTDAEKHAYMGRQHRWLLGVQASAMLLVVCSVSQFALSDWRLLPFLLPAALYVVTGAVSLLSSTRTKRTSLADHLERVARYSPAVWPSVDVFLPTAGEPLDVLDNTYRHVARLDWPGRVVAWVLDDADRPEVRDLAARHGFAYRVRPNRGHLKKAGNLLFGYQQSDGDLIAIFDADFVPRPDYLRELVPYFLDPTTGIVQSPQYFDAVRGMPWLQRTAGATQELFYRWIQPARDASRAAICVGTCAIYRRSALQAAGGFAQIGHSEDVHTGVKLMKAGYQLRYVPVLVSKGLCPDQLLGFLNQQYRWCTGSMSLLADRSFHANPIFTWRQRISFWSGFLYYISTGVNIFLAPAPGLVMLYAFPHEIHPGNTAWLLGAVLLWYFVLPTVMHCYWRMDVLRVQQLYSFAHAVAIVHVVTRRTKEWVATGSANHKTTPLAVTITRVMRVTVALTQLSVWTGLVAATVRYGLHETWAVVCFGLLSSYVQLPMLLMRARPRAAAPAPAPAAAPAPLPPPVAALQRAGGERVFGAHPPQHHLPAQRTGRHRADAPLDGPVASPVVSPVASPVASPVVSPVASAVASPVASPADLTAELPTPAQLAAAQYARARALRAARRAAERAGQVPEAGARAGAGAGAAAGEGLSAARR